MRFNMPFVRSDEGRPGVATLCDEKKRCSPSVLSGGSTRTRHIPKFLLKENAHSPWSRSPHSLIFGANLIWAFLPCGDFCTSQIYRCPNLSLQPLHCTSKVLLLESTPVWVIPDDDPDEGDKQESIQEAASPAIFMCWFCAMGYLNWFGVGRWVCAPCLPDLFPGQVQTDARGAAALLHHSSGRFMFS